MDECIGGNALLHARDQFTTDSVRKCDAVQMVLEQPAVSRMEENKLEGSRRTAENLARIKNPAYNGTIEEDVKAQAGNER